MIYPCEIIRDLLPLYIDDVCSEESGQAVKQHLGECGQCRNYYKTMQTADGFSKAENNGSEEMKMADSLKKVKSKINKKIRNVIIGSAAAVLVLTAGFQVLLNAPIMKIDKSKVKVSAEVYTAEEFARTLKADGNADMQTTAVEDIDVGDGFVTVITTSSDYFLRNIRWEIKDDTIYISAFKTTVLNNKAKGYQKTMTSPEFRKINKIVFDEKGEQTVLWER